MRTYERNGIHVDQCTECRGVFLDRGELEHLITAETQWPAQHAQLHPPPPPPQPPSPQGGHPAHAPHGGYGKSSKKRRSFLEELFD